MLKEQLNSDLRDALRSGDDTRKSTIRMVLSSIHNAEIQARKPATTTPPWLPF